jgi:hypothetical protein
VRKNDPTGKSPERFLDTSVQPLVKKYSDFQKCQISPILSPSRAHKRGASRSSRTLGAGCGGRGSAADERHGCGRRSRVVLTPRRWRSSRREIFPPVTVTKKPDHRGEREVSRKPLRREGRTASAEPVCSCALFFVHFARETAGAARTRSSLRPLTIGGGTFPLKTRAKCAARSRSCVWATVTKATKQSIPVPHAAPWIASLRSQ